MDMLDLLSQFLDFSDWENFKNKHQTEFEKQKDLISEKKEESTSFSMKKIVVFFSIFFGIGLLIFSFFYKKNETCQFCFEDADTKELIKDEVIEITIFQVGESPITQKIKGESCFQWPAKNEKITFAIHAPYYHSDTITRVVKNQKEKETISLKKDDYALMIHLFSTSNFDEWEKRRNQLDQMIADDAIIFQVEKGNTISGLDMLNKEEFIDRLTLPINSLKNIRIIHSFYQGEKIYRLRFILEE